MGRAMGLEMETGMGVELDIRTGLDAEDASGALEASVCGEGSVRFPTGSSEASAGPEFQAAVSVSWLCRSA